MKKIFLMTFVSIFAVSAAFAQVKNVKKAYKLSEAYENPDFDQAETLIEEALTDPTTKDDPYTWWVAGHIQDRKLRGKMKSLHQDNLPTEICKMRLLTKLTTISSKVPNSKNCLTQKVKYRIS